MNKTLLAAAATVLAAPMLLLGTGAAQAAPAANGFNCLDDVCFFYDAYENGASWGGPSYAGQDLKNAYFEQDGKDGAGQRVKNNAASVINRNNLPLCVYYNENYTGPSDEIPPQSWGNLVATLNNNASYRVKHGGC